MGEDEKTIYRLASLKELLVAANHRFLEFISQIDMPEIGVKILHNLTQSKVENHHSYKDFNLLAEEDISLLRLLLRGEFAISGLTSMALRKLLPDKTAGQISRILKCLRMHGLIKRVGRCYEYYLTKIGRQVAVMALKLRELYVIPTFVHTKVT